ncbi:MAG: arginyltransferase [Thioalkalispiraceae bacterium]|jgi:arginine-tRNA-protein transferase
MNHETALQQVFQKYQFYISPEHPCSYLEQRVARTLFVDPAATLTMHDYGILLEAGFRRSGENVYRPACETCQQCIPLRIPVAQFRPRRNQRRNWVQNQALSVSILNSHYIEEHYHLYRTYMQSRHPGGGMDQDDPDAYQRVITSSWSDTLLYEFRDNGKLVAVAVVDEFKNALSAVYTFFHPDYATRSPGRYAVLYEIERARTTGKDWLYLGYWNPDCQKMSYKNEYHPHEIYRNMNWQVVS